jgi:hypothetical protein
MTALLTETSAAPLGVDELSAAGLLAEASSALRVRRGAEVAELELAAQWAVLHGEPHDDRDPMVTPGGDGSPSLREHALPELAMARETHPATTRALVADVLDLIHRLPLTWTRVRSLECEPWVARKVAVLSRSVPAEAIGVVDRAVAAAIRGHAPATVLELARAKVIEADPEGHAMERERSRHERYVTLSRADEFGFRHVIARVTAGDAAWVDAMVDRVADILALEHGHDHNHDELRADALGWLARPADLLRLLLEHARDDGAADGASSTGSTADTDTDAAESETSPGNPADAPPARPVWAPDHLARTIDLLASLTPRQLASMHGRGTVFVHVTEQALSRQAGIARVEGVGPMLVQSLSELLGHADVALRPVLDLADRRRVDAYEHPDALKDHVWAQTGGDVFPFSPRTATRDRVDFDHPTPYVPPDRGGPPGQTGAHNSGPLRRRHHRWKTHGGYRCRQAGPGRHLWQTPHGLFFLVDHTGTRALSQEQAETMLAAPAGVEIYWA